jgi:hypothetical protein
MTAAGFYHCAVKNVGRANGRSVVAAAAYRAGERLEDARTGEVFDYRARGGVVDSFIMAPDNAPDWVQDRAQLWSNAELAETRANGRLATELELALPHEQDRKTQQQLVRDFLAPIIAREHVAADVAIHEPSEGKDDRNIHAHVLLTSRMIDEGGFIEKVKGQRKDIGVSGFARNGEAVLEIRKEWEAYVNQAYERAGLDIRVDHRSHQERGIEQEPTKHLGPAASAMERRGEESDRGDTNREIEASNAAALRERAADEITALKAEADRAAAEQLARMERAAADRITEPVAPIHDRGAAEAAWQSQLIADAAAKAEQEAREAARGRKDDTRGPQEARTRQEALEEERNTGGASEPAHASPEGRETASSWQTRASVGGGGHRDPWMKQTGGVDGLSEEYLASAQRSYARWAEDNPELARKYGFESYVEYVQEKWAANPEQERTAESAGGLGRASARTESPVAAAIETSSAAIDRGTKTGEGILRGIGNIFASFIEAMSEVFAPAPRLTPEQAERAERVAEERAEVRTIDNAEAAREAQRWAILEISRQQREEAERDPRLAAMMQLHAIPTSRTEREPDRGYERERE